MVEFNNKNHSQIMNKMPPNHQNTKSLQKEFKEIPQELDEIGRKIVHAAYLVHKALGPGLVIYPYLQVKVN